MSGEYDYSQQQYYAGQGTANNSQAVGFPSAGHSEQSGGRFSQFNIRADQRFSLSNVGPTRYLWVTKEGIMTSLFSRGRWETPRKANASDVTADSVYACPETFGDGTPQPSRQAFDLMAGALDLPTHHKGGSAKAAYYGHGKGRSSKSSRSDKKHR